MICIHIARVVGSGGRDFCALQSDNNAYRLARASFRNDKNKTINNISRVPPSPVFAAIIVRCLDNIHLKKKKMPTDRDEGYTTDSGMVLRFDLDQSAVVLFVLHVAADCNKDNEIMVETFVQQCTNDYEHADP
jgi:hypothetical protein